MWLLYLVLAPVIVLQAAWLLYAKKYRDTAVFLAISLSGFALWGSVAYGRPIILNAWIGRIIEAAKSLVSF
ncbi:MAG: hypothetical protein A9Z00_09570 [Thermobacillus sp. ZCTH02-B1]|uniref:hypothetical protein n=1 Tax=Thermobacillus sp. ZCTH02-B1 TaxID=1858795 RepID=UPI000B54B337|nr:hypothetical protein [Thermobacillus sp. ZCTH02-B1]OUM97514.1 MAG: hypothetical protein A9Z00_09570 [Thermobacillus sp. ZCTH02-B1]